MELDSDGINLNSEGDFQMENGIEQDEFSFKKIWLLLKASFVRIVVFCVIAGLTMGIVSAIVLTTTRQTREQISATYSYSHSGIENGKAPDGTSLDVNKIKSPQIVTLAINEYNLNTVEKIDLNKVSSIIQSISINPHIPSDIMSQVKFQYSLGENANTTLLNELLNVFPSQYTISIDNLTILSRKQAIDLLNEIINQYTKDFKQTYGSPVLLDNLASPLLDKDADVSSFEFLQLQDFYEENIRLAVNYLNTHASMNSLFRSKQTGRTFREIADNLNSLLSTSHFQLETYILQNSLANDPNLAIEHLKLQINLNKRLQKNAEENANSIFKLIEQYDNGDIIMYLNANGEVVTAGGGPTDTYNALVNTHNSYIRESNNYATEVAALEARLAYFADKNGDTWTAKNNPNNTAANRATAREMSTALVAQINNFFEIANTTSVEYYETEYMKNAVNITLPAMYMSQSTSLIKTMLVISAAVVFLTLISAIITTHIVITKKKTETIAVAE